MTSIFLKNKKMFDFIVISIVFCTIFMKSFVCAQSNTNVSIHSQKKNESVTFSDSDVNDLIERHLTVNVVENNGRHDTIVSVKPVSSDSGSHWSIGPYTSRVSTEVSFTGCQRPGREAKTYQPIFSGVAGPKKGGREYRKNDDFDWTVTGTYQLTCSEKCKSGIEVEVPVNYDLSLDKKSIKIHFEDALHKQENCKVTNHVDHTIDWSKINSPAHPQEVTVYCDQNCNIGTINFVPGDYEIVVTPNTSFSGRSNSRFGLGETATVTILDENQEEVPDDQIETLEIIGNSDTMTINANKITAGWVPGTVQIHAIVNGTDISYTVAVIEPSGIYQNLKSGSVFSRYPNNIGGGFKAFTFLLPKDVSFHNLKVVEGNCKEDANGIWKGKVGPHLRNEQWGDKIASVGKGNIQKGSQVLGPNSDKSDMIQFVIPRLPNNVQNETGGIIWMIPWGYTKSTRQQHFRVITYANQNAVTNGINGTIISKCKIRIRAYIDGSVSIISEGGE
ncbi:MAG: hypothetical protein LBE12_02485 [Planctomycetaceae bacterium]|jgi:hypothetical protein|nr:hypothetical protein [Planctomycetaceae bacterium]